MTRAPLLICGATCALALAAHAAAPASDGAARARSNANAIGFALQVVGGQGHTCARSAAGAAWCWGLNLHGEVGDGSAGNLRALPVPVSGLGRGVVAISAGYLHSCALASDGTVSCWGHNDAGQLGDGSTLDANAPVAVAGLAGPARAIAAGGFHTCALIDGGSVQCWGSNSNGQLGDGLSADHPLPADVSGLPGAATGLSAGIDTSCAIDSSGGAWCWGADNLGQLGDGANSDCHTPVAVSGLSTGVATLSAGLWHTCAIADGGAWCWGSNVSGELGNGGASNSNTPVGVVGLDSGTVAIAAGGHHACALVGGAALCWGGNDRGQLGDGTQMERHVPVAVDGLANDGVAIGTGDSHSCVVGADGSIHCWGRGDLGQLGDGLGLDSSMPVTVVGFGDAIFDDGFN